MEVHDVMSQLPIGKAVENPDGTVNYGAPAQNARYVPPADPAYQPPTQHAMDSSARV